MRLFEGLHWYSTFDDFNPRTHRGVRPLLNIFFAHLHIISIHAPIVGCDVFSSSFVVWSALFQSTHPSWGATDNTNLLYIARDKFQSTHPSWGATCFNSRTRGLEEISIHAPIVGCDFQHIAYNVGLYLISIHAPIVGCDHHKQRMTTAQLRFQSTHPSWGATEPLNSLHY
mgnify:CR=1 FL=1